MSGLVRLQEKYHGEKVTIVAVYAARWSEESFAKHTKTEGISYPAIYDREDRIGKAYGVTDDGRKYPVTPTFLIGPDGKVLWEKTDFRHWPKSIVTLEAMIDGKLKESNDKK